MKFGAFKLSEAKGAILAHSARLNDGKMLKKGTVLTEEHLAILQSCGHELVTVAIPEKGDILEDAAATKICKEIGHPSLRADTAKTGRVNLFARSNGLFRVSKQAIDALNSIDPGVTVATLNDKVEVNDGRMVATVKIIPYGLSGTVIDKLDQIDLEDAVRVEPMLKRRIGLVQTVLDGTKPGVLDKTRRTLERRLEPSNSSIVKEVRVGHSIDEVSTAIENLIAECDLVVIFGASAISDIRDVIPASVEHASGNIIRFGMPVDPGNLLLLAECGGKPVLGAPGCARSPAENGFDWVLQQILSGSDPKIIDIAGMGVGGLLMETGARPHPRLGKSRGAGKCVALILAAGQSRRMGTANKMTVEVLGKPMVRHVVEAAAASKADQIRVVTGHKPEDVETALSGIDVTYVHNSFYADGLSTSLAAGISSLGAEVDRVLVLLGDMPFVTTEMINEILGQDAGDAGIIMATCEGKRGNPVLWPRRYFEELLNIEGDTGARHIIGANAERVVEVEIGRAAATDLDTPEAIAVAETER